MRWWPIAATVSTAFFVVSLGALLVAPTLGPQCADGIAPAPGEGKGALCQALLLAARSLVVGSGAILAGALTAALFTTMLEHAAKAREDPRPLVSIRSRRRS